MNLSELNEGGWWVAAGGKVRWCRNVETAEAWAKVVVRAATKQGWSEPRILNLNMSLIDGVVMAEALATEEGQAWLAAYKKWRATDESDA